MFGEVFLCQFPFTSGTGSKIRPALVLFDLQQDAVVCRVTSVSRTGPLDVTLNAWQAAGLLKPSVARLDRLVTAEKTIFSAASRCAERPRFGRRSQYMEQAHDAVTAAPNCWSA